MRLTVIRVVRAAFVCALAALATPALAGGPSEPRCDRARDAAHLQEFPNISADHTFCEVGYLGVRLEGGPYSAISLGVHGEVYLRNVLNIYTELGLGFGSQTRDRELGWVPSPFGRAYVGYPISWVKHRRNKRWVVDESSDGYTITTNFYTVDVPNHRRFIPEVGLEYGRPFAFKRTETVAGIEDVDTTLSFDDRHMLAPSIGFRWVRTYRLDMQAVDSATGSRWTGRVDNRAWIAAHFIPYSFIGASTNVGFDVEFGIPNNIGRLNQSLNMTLGGGYLPNGTIMARLGMEFMVKRF